VLDRAALKNDTTCEVVTSCISVHLKVDAVQSRLNKDHVSHVLVHTQVYVNKLVYSSQRQKDSDTDRICTDNKT